MLAQKLIIREIAFCLSDEVPRFLAARDRRFGCHLVVIESVITCIFATNYFHMTAERPTAVLTKGQREALRGEREPTQERTMRTRIRERIREGLRDFELIFDQLPEQDRERIFDSDLRPGATSMVAFLFEVLMDKGDRAFEHLLRDAMKRVAEHNGWYIVDFEFNVVFGREEELDRIEELFESGEASVDQATKLFQNDQISLKEYSEYLKSRPGE